MSEISRQLEELLDTMAVLTSLFEEETQALKTRDLEAVPALVSRKSSLAQLFEGQLSWLADLREQMREEITEDQKAALNEAAERFKQGLLVNVAALDAQRRASERVVGLIIDGVKRATEENNAYSRSSQMSSASGPLSVALNATF